MNNPANKSNVDNGVTFVQFLWEQCKPELELLDQNDINYMWDIVFGKTTRPVEFPESGNVPVMSCSDEGLKKDGFAVARDQLLNGIEGIKKLKKDAPENLKASFETDLDKMIYSLKKLDEAENKAKEGMLTNPKNVKINEDAKRHEEAANKRYLDSMKKKPKDQS